MVSKYLEERQISKKSSTLTTQPLQTMHHPASDNNIGFIPEKNEMDQLNETGELDDKLVLRQLELFDFINP
jgi:hypothetical protein